METRYICLLVFSVLGGLHLALTATSTIITMGRARKEDSSFIFKPILLCLSFIGGFMCVLFLFLYSTQSSMQPNENCPKYEIIQEPVYRKLK